jgi:phosphohistidine phosphatase
VKILIVRHGPAGDREEWEQTGKDDSLRPLTSKGKKEVRKAAAGLVRLVPALDFIATSPWVRAAQTAQIVNQEYGVDVEEVEQLTSDHRPEDLGPWLAEQRGREAVALVGHEPHLGLLTGYLLTGKSTSFVDLKKGGACLVEMDDPSRPGSGCLEWLLSDRELRRLGQ